MIDTYIFGFLLSKINVNLFQTSGPIILINAIINVINYLLWRKHGEIGEDSKAAPEKVVYQPFAKNQN